MENGICQLRGNETGSWFEVKDLNSLVTRADRRGSAGGEAAPPGTFYNILALIVSYLRSAEEKPIVDQPLKRQSDLIANQHDPSLLTPRLDP